MDSVSSMYPRNWWEFEQETTVDAVKNEAPKPEPKNVKKTAQEKAAYKEGQKSEKQGNVKKINQEEVPQQKVQKPGQGTVQLLPQEHLNNQGFKQADVFTDVEVTANFVKNDDNKKFARQMKKLVLTYVTVFVECWKFEGVLVAVFDDFLVLVNGCKIIEIPLKEIQALVFRAFGCPPEKKKKTKNDKNNGKDYGTILRNMFSDGRSR